MIDFMTGMIKTLQATATGNPYRDDPANVFNEQWDGIEVDTCIAFDTEQWETGIDRGDGFKIAEQYTDRDSALAGHAKWVAALKDDPTMDLPDLFLWQ